MGWLASKVSRYFSILCLWSQLRGPDARCRSVVSRRRRGGVLVAVLLPADGRQPRRQPADRPRLGALHQLRRRRRRRCRLSPLAIAR